MKIQNYIEINRIRRKELVTKATNQTIQDEVTIRMMREKNERLRVSIMELLDQYNSGRVTFSHNDYENRIAFTKEIFEVCKLEDLMYVPKDIRIYTDYPYDRISPPYYPWFVNVVRDQLGEIIP